ncbi:MAG: hypothetical protein ABIH34_03275 [Nanoarchaeota archaeon]
MNAASRGGLIIGIDVDEETIEKYSRPRAPDLKMFSRKLFLSPTTEHFASGSLGEIYLTHRAMREEELIREAFRAYTPTIAHIEGIDQ